MRAVWMILLMLIVAWLLPWGSPLDPRETDVSRAADAPSWAHPLGTDTLGRDNWSRFLHGGRRTVWAAGLACGMAVAIGGGIGLLFEAGPRWCRGVLWAGVNAFLTLPTLFLALTLTTVGGRGELQVIFAVAFAQTWPMARVTRDVLRQARVQPFMDAPRVIGAGTFHTLRVYVVPYAAPQLGAYSTIVFSSCLFGVAALNFLGFGVALGTPEWGAMLLDGRESLLTTPWTSVGPGLGLTVVVWWLNRAAAFHHLSAWG